MPFPRFYRLSARQRDEILAVACHAFAAGGYAGTSYNKLIADARISKTTAYQYFDGKADLWSAALENVLVRLLEVLGPWQPSPNSDAFWEQLAAGSARLSGHLAAHPDDRAMAEHALAGPAGIAQWLAEVLTDGIVLGVIRDDLDRRLLDTATANVFAAVDQWALAVLSAAPTSAELDLGDAWCILARLWGTPRGKGPAQAAIANLT